MTRNVGILIDHQKALVVTIAGDESEVERIDSQAESHFHLSGGARSRSPYSPQDVASEHKYEERRRHRLQSYYQNIVKLCIGANELLIFGRGEAKTELLKEIVRSKELAQRVVAVETVDKMTQAQIVAMVRKRFAEMAGVSRLSDPPR
jgi:uncharacterized protein YunC (DUF1805 family)